MNEQVDALLQKLSELEQTVKEHKDDDATLDPDALREEVKRILGEMKEEEPVRKGEAIWADDDQPKGMGIKAIKEREVLGGRHDGAKIVDLWFAQNLCRATAGKLAGKDKHDLLRIADAISGEMERDRELSAALKAMTSTGTNTGDELVGEAFATAVWDDVFLATQIAGLFGPVFPMPAEKFTYPLNLGSATFYKASQNTAVTATDLATYKVQLDASNELVAEVDFSYHLEEDTLIALVPEIRRTLARNAAEALDSCCLNGDTTDADTGNINSYDANPADTQKYLIWDGLRHAWLVDVTANGLDQAGAPTADMFIDILALMGKYAAQPSRLAAIMDIQTYLKCMKIDEVMTVDKIGSKATLLNGQLASIWDIPIIVSGEAALTNTDGMIKSSSNTVGQVTVVHRDMWKLGTRRQLLIEADRDIQKRQHIIVVSFRPAFNCYFGGTSQRGSLDHTAGAYDITV